MRKTLFSTTLLVLFLASILTAHAAEATFFGPIVPPECNCAAVQSPNAGGAVVPSAPDWGCVMVTTQNTINFAITLGIMIAVLYIVWSGLLFMTSATNPSTREAAKTRIMNVVLGLLVVLAAWLLVDFIMKQLYNEAGEFGPWNSILGANGKPQCIQVSKTPEKLPGLVGQGPPGQATGAENSTPSQTSGSYSTQSEAARAVLAYANPLSIRDNLEYGGLIYRDENGQYGYTEPAQEGASDHYGYSGPVKGDEDGVIPSAAGVPSGAQRVGDYHTHGNYSLVDPVTGTITATGDPSRDSFNSDTFSEADRKGIVSSGKGIAGYRGYLGTPSGRFLYFDAATQVEGPL